MGSFPPDGIPHTGGLGAKHHQLVHGGGRELHSKPVQKKKAAPKIVVIAPPQPPQGQMPPQAMPPQQAPQMQPPMPGQ